MFPARHFNLSTCYVAKHNHKFCEEWRKYTTAKKSTKHKKIMFLECKL